MEQIQNLITKRLTNNQDRVPKAYTRKGLQNSHIAGAQNAVTVDAKAVVQLSLARYAFNALKTRSGVKGTRRNRAPVAS